MSVALCLWKQEAEVGKALTGKANGWVVQSVADLPVKILLIHPRIDLLDEDLHSDKGGRR